MDKEEFIAILKRELKDFPEGELSEILFYYKEYFDLAYESGKSSDEVIKELGNPYEIVEKFIKERAITIDDNFQSNENNSKDKENVFTKDDTSKNHSNITSKLSNNIIISIIILILSFILFGAIPFGFSWVIPRIFICILIVTLGISVVGIRKERVITADDDFQSNKNNNKGRENIFTKDDIPKNHSEITSKSSNNIIISIIILILSLILFGPITLGFLGVIASIFIGILIVTFGTSVVGIGLLLGKVVTNTIGVLVFPAFILDFPNIVIAFSVLGSICLFIFTILCLYYLIKLSIRLLRKIINWTSSKIKEEK